jgi:hypothetical protein
MHVCVCVCVCVGVGVCVYVCLWVWVCACVAFNLVDLFENLLSRDRHIILYALWIYLIYFII